MYVNDNGTWKPDVITGNNFVNEAKLKEVFNSIGPVTVDDLLKRNP